jgi:uncharacterized protein YndB with AHSA1/START domain
MNDEGRIIDLSVEVPGTPEEVWEAIATGPGISSWFVPHTVEQREGGRVTMDFGPDFGEESAEVTAWEPPHRFETRGGGDRALAFEWLVEARDGGTCVVRLVNSGFGPGEDWDADYEGMSSGWRLFLENLRLHRVHFAGRHARALTPTRMAQGPLDAAFARLCAELGIRADLAPGDRFATSGAGVPELAGTVASVHGSDASRSCFLLLDAPVPGHGFVAAEGMGEAVAVSVYLYLYGEGVQDREDEVSPFLARRFPAPEAVAAGG